MEIRRWHHEGAPTVEEPNRRVVTCVDEWGTKVVPLLPQDDESDPAPDDADVAVLPPAFRSRAAPIPRDAAIADKRPRTAVKDDVLDVFARHSDDDGEDEETVHESSDDRSGHLGKQNKIPKLKHELQTHL